MPTPSASEVPLIGAPDAAATDRFRRDLLALTGGAAPDRTAPLGVAVSGGSDSLALLLLAHTAFPGAVHAATVDHRLRPESADEAAAVAALCARLGVPHATLAPAPDRHPAGNILRWARTLRYALLARWAAAAAAPIRWVAVAHQQDDVAETLVMRMRRGAGVGGLAAMAPTRALPGGEARLLRPLLGWSRAELAALVAAAGITAIEDPSNSAARFDRSRIRALLADSTAELPAARLAMAAHNLREAEAALAWVASREWAVRHAVEPDGTLSLDIAGLPGELRRRLARRAIETLLAPAPLPATAASNGLDRLVATLDTGRGATLAGVAVRPGKRWRFRIAPPRRSR